MAEQAQQKEIKVEFPSNLRGGVYCNNMVVAHTREEFIMDFMMIAPPAGAVTARVVMSPGHMKRTVVGQFVQAFAKRVVLVYSGSGGFSLGYHKLS